MKPREQFLKEVGDVIERRLPSVNPATRTGLLGDVAYLSRSGVDSASVPVAEVLQPVKSKYVLGKNSLDQLAHVHPKLKLCVELAITYTEVDFRVNQGLRTIAEQKANVAKGVSRTLHSKHLPQADGLAWAVDLVALVSGVVSWKFEVYADIAYAMDKAATELGIAGHIRWGCAWDRVLSDFGGDRQAYIAEAKAYSARHVGSDLLDAPHFEWVA